MLRAFRYRLYPNQAQQAMIRKTVDACRFFYNWALETMKITYETTRKTLSWFDLNNRLVNLKEDYPFLKEAYSQSLQQAIKRLHLAFQHFFRWVAQGNEQPGYPKFKRRKAYRHSFDVPQFFIVNFFARCVKLPKIGMVKTIFHRRFTGKPRTCSIISTHSGKFFISIVVDDGKRPPPKLQTSSQTSVGVDVGLTTYITLSTGEKVGNPRHLRNALKRLQCLHRRLSKKMKGSCNREKARQRLACCYERVVNQRMDFQHKLSTRLIRENQAIMVESLNVSSMMRIRHLAKSIADVAWSQFLQMLRYKAEWYGVTLVEVGRFVPTSKCCHGCSYINYELSLTNRVWTCPACSMSLDRDLNAAKISS
ncbi:MAG: RNA-guided endonuclease TnpB family protein [Candidatus Hermodarchaeota archaeon]|nr:RNA-guided endonuclease TnpB family protein [Candidatus Hermodarchaeota archaeon]